jgi:hypothetical protein
MNSENLIQLELHIESSSNRCHLQSFYFPNSFYLTAVPKPSKNVASSKKAVNQASDALPRRNQLTPLKTEKGRNDVLSDSRQ